MAQAPTTEDLGMEFPTCSMTEKRTTKREDFTVSSYGLTDPGKSRPRNEDQFLIATLGPAFYTRQSSVTAARTRFGTRSGQLFIVADGMGGHAAGDQASASAIEHLQALLLERMGPLSGGAQADDDRVLSALREALDQADAQVFAEARSHPSLHGMGTTITLVYAYQDKLYVAHAGDSRCYLLREGRLRQITCDHTMAQELVRTGALKADEALQHPWRHVITNAVGGTDRGVRVEGHVLTLQPGDCLLLCSDGLTDMLSDNEIAAILQSEPDPRRTCEALVAQANAEGGRDNITAIVARFDE
jgi:PPM family protein phosphatase